MEPVGQLSWAVKLGLTSLRIFAPHPAGSSSAE